MKILVTGGAGFIGSALIRYLINASDHEIVNVDKLTYAGNLAALTDVGASDRYQFLQQDICDAAALRKIFDEHTPTAVVHLAAESHVDRSIDAPANFIQTNIVGTFTLLEAALDYFRSLSKSQAKDFRFLHVSTDEVFGSLAADEYFSESTAYSPNSPYSASKAGSDHLVRAWATTYGLPTLITNCSNNYGPFQNREKLIPLMILNAFHGNPLPVYGDGQQVRDWLHVDDHARALRLVLENSTASEEFVIGGNSEHTNVDVVEQICLLVDELAGPRREGTRRQLIRFVEDRPGHDRRYAVDDRKIRSTLGWKPGISFESGLRSTVEWYLRHANRLPEA